MKIKHVMSRSGKGTCLSMSLLSMAGMALTPLNGLTAEPAGDSDQLKLARETLEKHFEMQRLTSEERSEWAQGKEILESRIEFVRVQVEDLKERSEESEGSITEADKEREELLAQNEDLDRVEEMQFAAVEGFEARLRELTPTFPEVLRSKIQPLLDRLPEPGKERKDIKLTISQRFQNILGILNEVNRFGRDITVVAERRKMADGREAEVQTMYVGFGQAFYVGSGETAEVAGIGIPGKEGWEWELRAEEAKAIGRLIKTHSGALPAEFVPAPVKIK